MIKYINATDCNREMELLMKGLIASTIAAGGILGLTKAVDSRLEVSKYDISSEEIPKSFDGYKIIHLSDAHSDTVPGLISEIEEEKPDLIVCTGDMTDDDGRSFNPTLCLMKKLVKIAPVHMVTGNHDLARDDFLKLEENLVKIGARFLHNERVLIEKNGETIALSGIDDPVVLSEQNIYNKVKNAAQALGRYDGYEILLFHRANLFEILDGYGFNLVLAGHMHGGHVRLPGLGGMVSPKTSVLSDKMIRPKYFAGCYNYSDMTMLVSRGLGNPMLIPRIYNRPEVILVRLHSR